MTISTASRQRIRQRANFLCEYCHSSEEASASLFTFDHLIPQSLGGTDSEDNLALACHRCNGRRYNFTDGIDPENQTIVPLFNPRQNQWSEHFIWSVIENDVGVSTVSMYPVKKIDSDYFDESI